MSQLNVEVIRSSFENVKPIALKAADKFYEILFTDYPASQALFKGVDLEKQQQALINSLTFVVNNLEDSDNLKNYLIKLGNRHHAYGTKEEHFSWVGSSLIKTLQFFFADKWSEQLEQEWTNAFGIISKFMLEGLEYAAESSHTPKKTSTSKVDASEKRRSNLESRSTQPKAETHESNQSSSNIIKIGNSKSFQVSQELKNKIKNAVRTSIENYIEQEIKKVLDEEVNKITDEEINEKLKKIVNI